MLSINRLMALFVQKIRKVFTYEFWRKRFTIKFWQRRLTLDFWFNRYKLWMDELSGLDFEEVVKSDALGLDPDTFYDSAPSGNRYLRSALKKLSISNQDAIVDIGSGKGSAMQVLLEFPFSKVDGVEISSKLVEISQRNFQKMKIHPDRWTIYLMDATEFRELDRYNYFYFYNPFSPEILKKVLDNILLSVKQKPRKILIIYTNPVYEYVILSTGGLHKIGDYPGDWGLSISLYSLQAEQLPS